MSKKPTPGLIGNVEDWADYRSEEVSLGALKVTRIYREINENASDHHTDGEQLFDSAFIDGRVDLLLWIVKKAGFPEYPELCPMEDRAEIAKKLPARRQAPKTRRTGLPALDGRLFRHLPRSICANTTRA